MQTEKDLLGSVRSAGFETDLWTCPRVAKWFTHRFRALLGWGPQKLEARAIEHDEKAARQWFSQNWTAIKKSPKPEGLASIPL